MVGEKEKKKNNEDSDQLKLMTVAIMIKVGKVKE
jgi:hypothetical protein